jgi:hypothetical protein
MAPSTTLVTGLALTLAMCKLIDQQARDRAGARVMGLSAGHAYAPLREKNRNLKTPGSMVSLHDAPERVERGAFAVFARSRLGRPPGQPSNAAARDDLPVTALERPRGEIPGKPYLNNELARRNRAVLDHPADGAKESVL